MTQAIIPDGARAKAPASELPPGPGPAVFRSALSPLAFLERSEAVWPDRTAVVDGDRSWSYAEHGERVRRAADALRSLLNVAPGDRVATLLPNVAPMLELHYAVPGAGAVLVPLNTRLAADDYAYILRHSGATVVVAARSLEGQLTAALDQLPAPHPIVVWQGSSGGQACEYEELLAAAAAGHLARPADEEALLSINYTSGTTGRPKGVMTSHRGAYLHSLGVIADSGLTTRSAYLWTLPMFHCNGWAYTWAVTAAGAAHVCLPQVDPAAIWRSIATTGVTHMCAAPTVVIMMLEAEAAAACEPPVTLFVGGAPPSPTLLARAAGLNIEITHLYGLTETYGPIAVCAWNPGWDELDPGEQAALRARQGVPTLVSDRIRVVDPDLRDVPADGATMGEVVMRGNNVMQGYYRDPDGTAAAFRGGWFHSGDLAVMHPDGYFELRDRLKDIVISGGENIATIEVEQVLSAHPAISEAALVGAPDERWGEIPVAFVTLQPGAEIDPAEVRQFARARLAHFKVPKRIEVVPELPKTGTGKIQKFILRERAAPPAGPAAGGP
jgi:fatty-acyl-CoA synthase